MLLWLFSTLHASFNEQVHFNKCKETIVACKMQKKRNTLPVLPLESPGMRGTEMVKTGREASERRTLQGTEGKVVVNSWWGVMGMQLSLGGSTAGHLFLLQLAFPALHSWWGLPAPESGPQAGLATSLRDRSLGLSHRPVSEPVVTLLPLCPQLLRSYPSVACLPTYPRCPRRCPSSSASSTSSMCRH